MRVIQLLGLGAVFLTTLFIAFLFYTFLNYDHIISDQQKLLNYKDQGILLSDRENTPFYSINNAENTEYVPFDKISPYLKSAILAQEDKEFYRHNGISIKGTIRSLILNISERKFSYGGSTITQQLVKNTLLSPKKSITRKIQEALLAMDIEFKYPKDEIFEMYINTVYYGEGAIGIDQASKTYFNKEPKDLTIPESAYLAGMLKYPNLMSPYTGDTNLGVATQKSVIEKMRVNGYLTPEEANLAQNNRIEFKRGDEGFDNLAPHFSLMVIEELKKLLGNDVVYGGYKVKTSLDSDLQKYAQEILNQNVEKNRLNGISNGAVVSMIPSTGEVIAMVGSADWYNEHNGKMNMAVVPRQPGSSFKPIVYSLALDEGLITPATILKDSPKTFLLDTDCKRSNTECFYKPQNFDKKFRGNVTVRRALANSLNIPAVLVMEKLGIGDLITRAPSFGISTLRDASYYGKGLSLVLGTAEISPFEMASAYTSFANNGKRSNPALILEVKDKYGKVVYKNQKKEVQVLSHETAYLINSILSDNNARREQFGSILTTPYSAAVKTGTTENYRDAWTIGYTPNLVTAVWVGNNDSTPIKNLTGSLAASPIWKAIMTKYSERVAFTDFERPNGVVLANSCDPVGSGSAVIEYFKAGTQPRKKCPNIPKTQNIGVATQKNEEPIGGDIPTITPSPVPNDPTTEDVEKNSDPKESENNQN